MQESNQTPETGVAQTTPVTSEVPPIPVTPVVVPSSQNGIPSWFFALFVIVIVLFLIVTGILVWTLQSKTASEPSKAPVSNQDTSGQAQPPSPTVTIAPTITPKDTVVELLRTLNTSNEIGVISQDIDATDLSFLKEERSELDRIFGVSSP